MKLALNTEKDISNTPWLTTQVEKHEKTKIYLDKKISQQKQANLDFDYAWQVKVAEIDEDIESRGQANQY